MLRVANYSPPSTSRNRPLRRILAVTGLIGLLTLVLLLPHPHNFLPGQGSLFPSSISRYASRPGLLRHYQAIWQGQLDARVPSKLTRLNNETGQIEEFTFVEPDNVCMFAADTRHIKTPDELEMDVLDGKIERPDPWRGEYVTFTFWKNFLWASRHGYRHFKVTTQLIPGRTHLWAKLRGMQEVAEDRTCKYLIFTDGDVFVRQANYTLDDMRLRWGMSDEKMMTLAIDQPGYGGWNTGFLIMKNGPELREMLQRWYSCPDEIDGCEQYLDRPPGDQGAFDDYFIHPLLDAGKIALAPCAEATGSETEGPRTKCFGSIVTHGWQEGKYRQGRDVIQLLALEALQMAALIEEAAGHSGPFSHYN